MGYLRLVRFEPRVRSPDAGCVQAFDRELDYLFVTLQRFGARPADVDDLLQDIFVVLYRRWPTLDTGRPLRPWLFGVTFRVVRAHRRRRGREVPSGEVVPEGTSPSPDVELEDQEALAILSAALERVPLERRSVLVRHDIDGVEVVEIARQLAMTKFGVYTRLYKARKELASAVRRLQQGRARP